MTSSSAASRWGAAASGTVESQRRAQALVQQDSALPDGSVTVSCSAPLGTGGLGRHLQEILDSLQRRERESFCISGSTRDAGRGPASPLAQALRLPLSPGTLAWASAVDFDRFAAARQPRAEHLIAFNGQALAQLAAAARNGYASTTLVSANSHMRRVVRQHALAHRQYPLEGSWTSHMLRRNLREYERVDRVYVASGYIRDSFLAEGFPEDRLRWFPLTADPRFQRVARAPEGDTYEIVYVGSLAVHKGVPLLIDAIRRLRFDDIRLTLVGGWATRGMRRFIEGACAADRRITAGPGDPARKLATARLVVHPAFEDGFAYAPAEALAAGVPVIVSEDTGMKELIDAPRAGRVVPTGDLDALTDAIAGAYRGELFAGS